jgi:hypothetical protein
MKPAHYSPIPSTWIALALALGTIQDAPAQYPVAVSISERPMEPNQTKNSGAHTMLWGKGITEPDAVRIVQSIETPLADTSVYTFTGDYPSYHDDFGQSLETLLEGQTKRSMPFGDKLIRVPDNGEVPSGFLPAKWTEPSSFTYPGWRTFETWDYESGKEFVKTPVAMAPYWESFDSEGYSIGIAPTGIRYCEKPMDRAEVLDTWEVMYQVDLFDLEHELSMDGSWASGQLESAEQHFPQGAMDMMLGHMFSDLSNGKAIGRSYTLSNIQALDIPNRHSMARNSDRDLPAEIGQVLSMDSIKSILQEEVTHPTFDPFTGDIIGEMTTLVPFTSQNIGGFIFYETWSIPKGGGCLQKSVHGVAPTLRGFDEDGTPLFPSVPLGLYVEFPGASK